MSDDRGKRTDFLGTSGGNWGIGLAIGIAIGVALGVSMDNIGAGIAIGMGLAVAFALSFGAASKDRANRDSGGDGTDAGPPTGAGDGD